MRYLIILLLGLTFISCKDLEILKYEYHTSTQMGRTILSVTKDSVVVTFNGRGEPVYWAREIEENEWDSVVASMKDVQLDQVSNLKSPSNDRATDRVPIAKFSFVGKDSTLTSSSFDAGNPHEMLSPLMLVFKKIEESNLAKGFKH